MKKISKRPKNYLRVFARIFGGVIFLYYLYIQSMKVMYYFGVGGNPTLLELYSQTIVLLGIVIAWRLSRFGGAVMIMGGILIGVGILTGGLPERRLDNLIRLFPSLILPAILSGMLFILSYTDPNKLK